MAIQVDAKSNINQETFLENASIDKSFEYIPSYTYEENKLSTKIVLYSSFEERDIAISKLDVNNIQYIFQSAPMITLKNLDNQNIPKKGLLKIVDDRKVVLPDTYSSVQKISDLSDANSLNASADVININDLRGTLKLTGKGKKIAILDSGVAIASPAFYDTNGNSRVTTYNVSGIVENSSPKIDIHGSHVAAIATGNGYFTIGDKSIMTDSPGMAPEAEILSIRVLDETGSGDNSWILEGIDYAIQSDVDVISMSLSSNLYYGEQDLHRILLNKAEKEGKIVVAAAGNSGPIGSGVGIPGGLESVIGVGGAFLKNRIVSNTWDASAVGPSVNDFMGADIIAPSNDILSLNYTTNGLLSLTGTSMATPHVSGGILLLLEAFPNANIYQIRAALLASASDVGSAVEVQGRGLVDFAKAYEYLRTTLELGVDHISTLPNRFDDSNYYFRNRLSGITKTFPVYFYSHKNTTIKSHVDEFMTKGVKFDLPDEINVTAGLTQINLNITVTSKIIGNNIGLIYFTDDVGDILPFANISYSSKTRYTIGNVLFDTAHDLDTPSGYFANHGPRGQFSKLSRVLEAEGYYITELRNGLITDEVLENIDLLVIADPDKNMTFSTSEFDAIESFLQVDSKSLLMIANGGIVTAEDLYYDDFNVDDMNTILKNTGLSIDSNDSIYSCNQPRIINCPNDAVISYSQDILRDGVVFPNYGPSLSVINIDKVDNIIEVAYQKKDNIDYPVIVASELSSKGRVIVFSSSLLFDNIGTTTDYIGGGSDVNNRQIARDAISWLLDPRTVKVSYSINGVDIPTAEIVNMYDDLNIVLKATLPDGSPIDLGEKVNVSVFFNEIDSFNIEFNRVNEGVYSRVFSFDWYGIYEFNIRVEAENLIPSSGKLLILATLQYMDNQKAIQKIAQLLLFLFMMSWIFWIKNEGYKPKRKEIIE